MSRKGFSLAEVLVALTIGALLVTIAIPAFSSVLRRSRLGAAVRQVTSDVREARSKAITSGWQYRVVGFDTASSTRRNQYRLLARSDTGVAWPATDAAPFQSATQIAGPWSDIGSSFPGVSLDYTATSFRVTFDARGATADAVGNFNPLLVTHADGGTTTLTISAAGGIRMQ